MKNDRESRIMSHSAAKVNANREKSVSTRQDTRIREKSDKEKESVKPVQVVQAETTMADDEVSNSDIHKILVSLDLKVTDGFTSIKEKLQNLSEKVESLEMDVENVRADQQNDHQEIEGLREKMEDMRVSLLTTQVYSRKYHLLLYGVEGYESNTEETIKKVRTFAKENLLLDEEYADNLSIRNAHRLQQRKMGPPAIIVVFMLWSERETFLREAKNLKETRMSVRTDLPPELKRLRGKLAEEAYHLRQTNKGLHTRIREKGADVWMETRRSISDTWKRR